MKKTEMPCKTAAQAAEIEALREDLEEAWFERDGELADALARADELQAEVDALKAKNERLAEALRELVDVFSESGMYDEEVFAKARAELKERAASAPPSATVGVEAGGAMLGRLGDDAQKWAKEFKMHAARLGYSDMDEGWLISWFANAIEHSSDVRRWRREAALSQQPAAPDFCDGHCTWLDHAPGCPRHDGQQPSADKFIATFRCEGDGIIGTTPAKIHSVAQHDDGCIEVVIDHWPQQSAAPSGYTCTVPDDCETLHWRGQILSMNELASVVQPTAGEEIMANAAVDWDEVHRVAQHIGAAADYIDTAYPDANMLDRGPIMRNMRRWHERLTTALAAQQQGGRADG